VLVVLEPDEQYDTSSEDWEKMSQSELGTGTADTEWDVSMETENGYDSSDSEKFNEIHKKDGMQLDVQDKLQEVMQEDFFVISDLLDKTRIKTPEPTEYGYESSDSGRWDENHEEEDAMQVEGYDKIQEMTQEDVFDTSESRDEAQVKTPEQTRHELRDGYTPDCDSGTTNNGSDTVLSSDRQGLPLISMGHESDTDISSILKEESEPYSNRSLSVKGLDVIEEEQENIENNIENIPPNPYSGLVSPMQERAQCDSEYTASNIDSEDRQLESPQLSFESRNLFSNIKYNKENINPMEESSESDESDGEDFQMDWV
jgi:hypothetical protein